MTKEEAFERVWLTPEMAAERLRLTVYALVAQRSEGRGPRYCKRGALVRYHVDDVDAWIRGEKAAVRLVGGQWMTPAEAADYLSTSKRTLQRLRTGGRGPVFKRNGTLVRYWSADLDAWMRGGEK